MSELLSELREACRQDAVPPETDLIRRGPATRFSGRPAPAPEGTVALSFGDDARIIIDERDVLAVRKEGESYSVEVGAETNVLVRIEKLMKATPQPGRDRGGTRPVSEQRKEGEGEIVDIEIGPITVCDLVCGTVDLFGFRVYLCIPVNCRVVSAT